ncbi:gamma-butyrobetaine dioxygenase [Burkholderia oklahomensis]|uniref:Gamma-butyrobetaine hydroxylase n=1 Tax=Burkholderia oklahomensis TaxID=342113 RepID=A0AAI8FQ82_9BURK|nr:gamma-butyrobetaine dioxygenase [Burkholderia oklahomensis]AIO68715.1 gamma-butyrobetaine hydroxylase [Burkholderia oklahomensis]AJX34173.1 gamma-butyrobetaine hydroxylase [Burkholderia oklahomensis C6786]AOI39219.1 gamma-butyrobetaine dioxygenase [Burkholderia oklahomensis EO147]AOI48907.1 gamma-butyrobetaine dioxygenase [Burkholderia oklahomensis C6786]KUY50491.1 gamma-butyrobetaine dioxygenase [Burkholderia oklahomensis C6786]
MNAIADYRTYPLISALIAARRAPGLVEVDWADGRVSPFHNLWLRDNCPCPACVYSVTREQVFEIADMPEDLEAATAEIDAQGALAVQWQDGHVSRFDPGWLRAHAYDDASRAERHASRPRRRRWSADLALPAFDYRAVMEDPQALLAWLSAVRDTGLTQVRGLPCDPGTLIRIARRVSFIRETNFGMLFDVQSKTDADSNAYTAFNLPLHTDLPTRELQPGLQFLHCLINDARGGDSTFVDGFAIAEALRGEEPDAYRLLCDVPVEFRNKDRHSDYRCLAPVIALDPAGEVAEIRIANFLRGPFDIESRLMQRYYRAYRRFIEMTRDERFRFRRRLEAGQMWCFDNRRVLHARDAFDPASGARHFQGCYIDRDELLSRILVLQR